jgi:hypothetical protein
MLSDIIFYEDIRHGRLYVKQILIHKLPRKLDILRRVFLGLDGSQHFRQTIHTQWIKRKPSRGFAFTLL